MTEGELTPEATIRKFRIVRFEGKREVARELDHYNLSAILAVGYRVRSPEAHSFKISGTSCETVNRLVDVSRLYQA